jgi:hypothetical protein
LLTLRARDSNLQSLVFDFFCFFQNLSFTQGAATQVFLAANPKVEGKTGKYYVDCNEHPLEGKALDIKLQAALWKWAEDYVSTH